MSAMARVAARQAELRRDAQILRAALSADIAQIFETARVAETPLPTLWLDIHDATAANREAAEYLVNLRETLRSNPFRDYQDSVDLPAELQWFRHRGAYHGVYETLRELGNILRPAMKIALGMTPEARANVARTLHLRGKLWTYEDDARRLHVFARPYSTVDALLAAERPRLPPLLEDPLPESRPARLKLLTPLPEAEREPDAPLLSSRGRG
ncbi:hypothetical protein OV203_46655 [Nannocystis sp. ILAH1]|uniref:hypothetical protein n=1 Tax=Nannocystis sp. ILAH1 TaxID=2996789 RepID=UPI0022710987|nr:hypothetical protein [Nannocystis sp. ILAH1]MCY0994696.1 hypothetical protein [Nannocystis sp. ILAH1]